MDGLSDYVAAEPTAIGWRGLTQSGEIHEVRSASGMPAGVSSRSIVAEYQQHHDRAVELFWQQRLDEALSEIDAAMALAATGRAAWNRSQILLALGRWREGLAEYERRFEPFTLMKPEMAAAAERLPRWHGEPLEGKRLLVIAEQGFGDQIMMLRFVRAMCANGAAVGLMLPSELKRLASRLATVDDGSSADFYVPIMSLLHELQQTPGTIPRGTYLTVEPQLTGKWIKRWGERPGRKVGIAWSTAIRMPSDFKRAIPLAQLVGALGGPDGLVSVQTQEREEAEQLGVTTFDFEDFADCAALMMTLDKIVTVDTAAVHLAGAIGHPNVTMLLSHVHSWRWLAPWYPNVRFCRQRTEGDWASALAQL
jgi:hypothetical protein